MVKGLKRKSSYATKSLFSHCIFVNVAFPLIKVAFSSVSSPHHFAKSGRGNRKKMKKRIFIFFIFVFK